MRFRSAFAISVFLFLRLICGLFPGVLPYSVVDSFSVGFLPFSGDFRIKKAGTRCTPIGVPDTGSS